MKTKLSRNNVSVLATTLALAVVAGCSTPPVAPSGEGTVGQTAANGVGTVPSATGGKDEPAKPADPGLNTNTGDLPVTTVPLNTEGLAVVDTAKAVNFKASEGGVYVSDDGLLTAKIPPNALSQDTTVRFARIDTSKERNTNSKLSGIRFQMDIGDAYILPGTAITVSSKADDRLIPELKNMYSDYAPELWALSQDEKGNWNITMLVKGPAAKPMDLDNLPVDRFLTDRRGIMTEGAAPLPAGKGGNFKRDSRIEAFCDYAPPPPAKPQHQIRALCKWESDDPSLDGKPAFDANSRYNTYVRYGNTSTTAVTGVTGYWSKEKVPGSPAVAEVSHFEMATGANANGVTTTSGKNFKFNDLGITFATLDKYDDFLLGENDPTSTQIADAQKDLKSDRVSVNNDGKLQIKVIDTPAKAAVPESFEDIFHSGWIDLSGGANETTRSGYEWNGYCHCTWVVYRDKIVEDPAPQPVNANGVATNLVRETFTITAQGYSNEPNPTPAKYPGAGVGDAQSITVTGPATLNLRVPRYSPLFGITLESEDKAMQGEFELTVNIDGVGERKYNFNVANETKSYPLSFRVLLPDNEAHPMSVKELRFLDNSLVGKQQSLDILKNIPLRRNGIIDGYKLNLVPAAAK